MPCSAGRELKQMLVNATNELADANAALTSTATPPSQGEQTQRQRRVDNAKKNHAWTSSTLLEHLRTCSACRERESALRPAYQDPVLPIPPIARLKLAATRPRVQR